MSRFSEPQADAFRALNDSISFDWRLGPYDVEQSRAHAAMLASRGSSPNPNATSCSRHSSSSRPSFPTRPSGSPRTTRTSTWRSSAASPSSPARSEASSTRRARATIRSRPTWPCSSERTRASPASGSSRSRWCWSRPPKPTSTGRCPATHTFNARSPCISSHHLWHTCGCCCATAIGSAWSRARRRRCRWEPARSRE